MSGVYIKGIKLPTIHEGQMVIRIEPSGKADVQWSGLVGGEYTKAVEVPDHGRLKDVDDIICVCEILSEKGGNPNVWEQMIEIAESVQTVIPADRSE